MKGWNRCDDCGRFADPSKLSFDELRHLDLYGNLVERYPQYHTKDEDCVARRAASAEGTE